ncbi:Hypothetical predicted protein [Olea europaea subsp. europaea]|uniref:Uncharacterized protein n=1 Tax=Olea europaea subsp. europaea TaxID=158383 RepID=A0A8S0RDI8_OLEEU|nr:Hypothetical predicted protein [Olea europaea subsp. europaea]
MQWRHDENENENKCGPAPGHGRGLGGARLALAQRHLVDDSGGLPCLGECPAEATRVARRAAVLLELCHRGDSAHGSPFCSRTRPSYTASEPSEREFASSSQARRPGGTCELALSGLLAVPLGKPLARRARVRGTCCYLQVATRESAELAHKPLAGCGQGEGGGFSHRLGRAMGYGSMPGRTALGLATFRVNFLPLASSERQAARGGPSGIARVPRGTRIKFKYGKAIGSSFARSIGRAHLPASFREPGLARDRNAGVWPCLSSQLRYTTSTLSPARVRGTSRPNRENARLAPANLPELRNTLVSALAGAAVHYGPIVVGGTCYATRFENILKPSNRPALKCTNLHALEVSCSAEPSLPLARSFRSLQIQFSAMNSPPPDPGVTLFWATRNRDNHAPFVMAAQNASSSS